MKRDVSFFITNFLDIDLSIIMKFNKIKIMTKDKNTVIRALQNSKIVEFNSDYTKIRKIEEK